MEKVLPSMQKFLDQLKVIKEGMVKANFKPNQTTERESMARATIAFNSNVDKTLTFIDESIMNEKYPVPIRIYLPKDMTNPSVSVYIHGGGHMCNGLSTYDNVARNITLASGNIIVLVDYRLSPEFAYPTAMNDCKCVISNIFSVLESRNVKYKNNNLTIMGDSAGGALTASINADKNFVLKNNIKKQVLIYPSLDYTCESESMKTFASGYLLEVPTIKWYFDNYFQNNEDRKSVSALYKEFYKEMPETLTIIASHDPLKDDGKRYHKKLQEIGVKASFSETKGVIHAYLMLEDLCKAECESTYLQIKNFLK